MKQIENLTKEDTIDLASLGEGKKALFVIIPAADSTYNFLVSMMYSQLFETLYFVAETVYEGKRLKTPVRFLLDEFANIGQIPEFTKKLATMRKYEISCTIILQNLAQIKTAYKDDWESIVGNCDSFLYLGGQEYSTLEYISKELGKKTIKTKSYGTSLGKQKSSSKNRQMQGRELMTPDEIARMPSDECIVIIRGLYPFNDKKFEYTKHENYPKTGDADKSLLYINTKDNSEPQPKDVINEEYDKIRAARFAKFAAQKPENVQPISIETFINSLNIHSAKEAAAKIIVIGPEEYQQVKPSQKEQQEQAEREQQRQEKKKKKKKKQNANNDSNNMQTNKPNVLTDKEKTESSDKQDRSGTESAFDNVDFDDFDTVKNKKES